VAPVGGDSLSRCKTEQEFLLGRAWTVWSGERKRPPGFAEDRRSFPLSWGERFHEPKLSNSAPEPTPSPSKEGSAARWIVPLLGGVRGGWVGGRFMGRAEG